MVIGFCPDCGKDQSLDILQKKESVTVRDERYFVLARYHKCTICGAEFYDETDMIDPRTEAYYFYKQKHGMVCSDELKKYRERYNLSIIDFSNLLGMNEGDLQRYENGALHTMTEDKLFKFVVRGDNLSLLVNMHESDNFKLYIRGKIEDR